jgi:hypothetical protein
LKIIKNFENYIILHFLTLFQIKLFYREIRFIFNYFYDKVSLFLLIKYTDIINLIKEILFYIIFNLLLWSWEIIIFVKKIIDFD